VATLGTNMLERNRVVKQQRVQRSTPFYNRKSMRSVSVMVKPRREEEVELKLVNNLSGDIEVWRERRIFVSRQNGYFGVWVSVSGTLLSVLTPDGCMKYFN
jgi:hypothetical protein